MQNEHSHPDYSALITKYLSGNTTDAEVRDLEKWVLSAPENKAQFMASKKAWMLGGMQGEYDIDVDKNWHAVVAQISGAPKVVPMKRRFDRRQWLGIAAAVALLLMAAVWLFLPKETGHSMLAQTSDEIKTIELSDGSEVTLNRFSSLRFTPSTTEGKRKVELEGDAFFEVQRNEAMPFLILVGGVEVEVLGTSFYVDAREDQTEIQVVVQSGSVAVRSDSSAAILLGAGEKAVFRKKSGILEKQQNDDPNYRSFTSGTLVFEQTPLAEVAFALTRQYHVDISVAPAIRTCELTATFADKSLDAILRILEATFSGIEIKREEQKIQLVGMTCD